ncbi:Sma2 [Kluyveromyces lactis]|nr:Sma2 [Kluyveromyces lactis]
MRFKYISFIILISFSLLVWFSHLSNFTCTSSANLPICMPQYVFHFKDDTPTSKVLFSTVKEFFSLLSFFTLDFNWGIDLSELQDRYNQSNLINIFHPSNTYYVNAFGYCKQQSQDEKLNHYCIDNTNGLNIISVLIRDLGFQFGVLSETNVKITGDSFWIIYQTLLNSFNKFLEDDKRGNTLLKMITPNDPNEMEQWKTRLWLINIYDAVNVVLKWTVVTNCILASLCLMLLLFWMWMQIEHKKTQSPIKQLNWNISSICTITRCLSICNATITFIYILHILLLAFMINCFRYKRLQIIHASLGTGAWFHIARFFVELIFAVLCFKWMTPHSAMSPSVMSETQSTAVEDEEEKDTEDNYSALNPASGTTAVDGFLPTV